LRNFIRDRLDRDGMAVVEKTSSRVEGMRAREGAWPCSDGGLRTKNDPTARNSTCR
jgi:hypothetical protein